MPNLPSAQPEHPADAATASTDSPAPDSPSKRPALPQRVWRRAKALVATRRAAEPVHSPKHLRSLRRIRWAVRGVLALGVAASVAANVLHALPNPVSQSIAAWPPLALLLTIELISRVPVHHPVLAGVRSIAAASIACIAGWISYGHMAGVAARYGETGNSAYLVPITVDGLIVVASVCLVELAGTIRAAEAAETAAADRAATIATIATPPAPPAGPVAAPTAAPIAPPAAAGLHLVSSSGDAPAEPAPVRRRTRGRTATLDDARRVCDGADLTRDELTAALRACGLSVSNAAAGQFLRGLRDAGRTPAGRLAPAATG